MATSHTLASEMDLQLLPGVKFQRFGLLGRRAAASGRRAAQPGSLVHAAASPCLLGFWTAWAQGGKDWAEKRGAGQPGALGAAAVPEAARGPPLAGGALAAAAAALAPAAQPRSMPCRHAERGALAAFLEEAVAAGETLVRVLKKTLVMVLG